MTSHANRPRLSPAEAARVADRLFGIKAKAKKLPGERDQNFQLSRLDGPDLLLKLTDAAEPVVHLELQNEIFTRLVQTEVAHLVPELLPALSGAAMAPLSDAEDIPSMARLLTFLPGRPVAEVAAPTNLLLRQLGGILGKVDKILAALDHRGADRYLQWDSRHAAAVIAENLAYVGAERLDLLRRLATTADARLEPRRAALRQSIIHNDANDYNVLVDGDGPGTAISGLIDFGDVVRSYTVAELANCAAYMMLDRDDPLAAAAQLACGYHRTYPLNDDEWQALFDLIVTRLCLSAAIGARQTRQDPDNAYLAVSQRPVWSLLARLGAQDYEATAAQLLGLIEQGIDP